MTLALDFSDDYLILDDAEAVTYTSVRTAAGLSNATAAVAYAFQYPVTNREKSPSNGVYQGFEKIWQIPGTLIGTIVPKPRDTITDAQGSVFTVQWLSYSALTKAWNLTCINLILAQDLRDVVTIEVATLTQDSSGAWTETWATASGYGSLAARLQQVEHTEADYLESRGLKGRFNCFLAQEVNIVPSQNKYRLKSSAGQYFEIRGYQGSERIEELPYIECERVP